MAAQPLAKRVTRGGKETLRFRTEAKALGRRVRALRLARELTLEAAAERMALDWKHVQKIEAGQINVTLATLIRLNHGLGEPIAALFPHAPRSAANQADSAP